MRRKFVLALTLMIIVTGILTLTFKIQLVKADWTETIYIRANGSVDPPTAPVSSVDNVTYTFTDNINDSIVVERDNIAVDGVGYTVQGTGNGTGISLTGRGNVTIRNVEIKAFRYGISLNGSSNSNISYNNITNNGEGISLWRSSNNTISGNRIINNTWSGVKLDDSSNNIITRNNIASNEMWGVEIWDASNNLVFSNNIANNEWIGVECSSPILRGSKNNTISGNNITASNWSGILLEWSSNSNISYNNITNNGEGISLWRSSNNTISGNNITANYWDGILLEESSDSTIYHNNFVNNTKQVDGYNSTNACDNGYPSGGNYWSDHVCTGNPSDGSQPYTIDEKNIDHYPFQDPNGWMNTLTIFSSPTGVTFTVDGVPRTTPWSATYIEGTLVSLVMPETHDDSVWFHWLEDGDTNRVKTVTMDKDITLTGVFTPHPPIISILLPRNKTYTEKNVPLFFTVDVSTSWIGYSLDSQTNVTVYGNTTLVDLSDGVHTITVYANDTAGNMGYSGTIYFSVLTSMIDTFPPTILILSPQNKTYATTKIPLTVIVDEPVLWMAYNLDNKANMTIKGDTTLSGLSDGPHSLIVYANDTASNIGASEIIYFTIETEKEEPFPTWIVTVVVIIAVAGPTLLIYFKKVKKTT